MNSPYRSDDAVIHIEVMQQRLRFYAKFLGTVKALVEMEAFDQAAGLAELCRFRLTDGLDHLVAITKRAAERTELADPVAPTAVVGS